MERKSEGGDCWEVEVTDGKMSGGEAGKAHPKIGAEKRGWCEQRRVEDGCLRLRAFFRTFAPSHLRTFAFHSRRKLRLAEPRSVTNGDSWLTKMEGRGEIERKILFLLRLLPGPEEVLRSRCRLLLLRGGGGGLGEGAVGGRAGGFAGEGVGLG